MKINNDKDGKIKVLMKIISLLSNIFFIIILIDIKIKDFMKNDITLVTSLFQIDTKRHKFSDYIKWVKNLLKINKPIVFFIQPNISEIIKKKRPNKLKKKTIWIERNFSSLYAYKHYLTQFKETFIIDKAKYKHSVDLFIIWSEKVNFLKESIKNNYFNTKYFFWVDAGLFRENKMENYVNDWPSIAKVRKDPRVILNGIRKIEKKEFANLMKFDHSTHEKFMNDYNVAAGFFGGRNDYLMKFIEFYYKVINIFYSKKVFIGSEQNIYSIIGYSHPEIVKIINSGDYQYLKSYFIPD